MRSKVGGASRRLGGLAVGAWSAACGAYALLTACSVSQGGTGPAQDGGGTDGTMDAGTTSMDQNSETPVETGAEAAPCNGLSCNGTCLDASDCRGCAAAPVLCAPSGKCVSGCETCVDEGGTKLPIGCFACDKTHQNPVGTCQYDDASAYCLSGDYFGSYANGAAGYQCDCSDAGTSSCPGKNQVCGTAGAGTLCFSCGETTIATIDGKLCAGGGSCNAASHTCQ